MITAITIYSLIAVTMLGFTAWIDLRTEGEIGGYGMWLAVAAFWPVWVIVLMIDYWSED